MMQMGISIQKEKYVIPAEVGIQQVIESYIRDKLLDFRFRAQMSGTIISQISNTAIQYGFTHGAATHGLEFRQSLTYRHSGIF